MSNKNPRREENERLKDGLRDTNIASAINIAAGAGKRSVKSKQRIVRKDGVTA